MWDGFGPAEKSCVTANLLDLLPTRLPKSSEPEILGLQSVGESGSAANFVWKLPWPKPKTEIVRRTGVGLIGPIAARLV